jgi:hypothetical protein
MKPEIPAVVKQKELFDYRRTNSYNRRAPITSTQGVVHVVTDDALKE